MSHEALLSGARPAEATHSGATETKRVHWRDLPFGPGVLPPPKVKTGYRVFPRGDGSWYAVQRRKNLRSTLLLDAGDSSSVVTSSAANLVHSGGPDGVVLMAFIEDDTLVVQAVGPTPGDIVELLRVTDKETLREIGQPIAIAEAADGGFALQFYRFAMGFNSRTDAGQEPVSVLQYSGGPIESVLDGHAFVSGGKKEVFLFVCGSGDLKLVDIVKVRPHDYYSAAGRVFIQEVNGDYRELMGVANLVNWAQQPSAPENVQREGVLTLATRPPPRGDSWTAVPKKTVRSLPLSGRAVHLSQPRKDGPFQVNTQDTNGALQRIADLEIMDGHLFAPFMCPSPDGTRCLVASEGSGGRKLIMVDPDGPSTAVVGVLGNNENKFCWTVGGIVAETAKRQLALYPIEDGKLGKRVIKGKAHKNSGAMLAVLAGRVLLRTNRLDGVSNSESQVFKVAANGELEELGTIPVAVESAWTDGDEVRVACKYGVGVLALPKLSEAF